MNLKYEHHIYNTEAKSIVLVNNDFKPEQPIESHTCKVENALCGARDVIKFGRAIEEQKEADSTAFIAASMTVSDDC